MYVNQVEVAFISNKPHLVDEYAFPLMQFVG